MIWIPTWKLNPNNFSQASGHGKVVPADDWKPAKMSPSAALIVYQPSNTTPGPFLCISEGLERVTVCKTDKSMQSKVKNNQFSNSKYIIFLCQCLHKAQGQNIKTHQHNGDQKWPKSTLAPLPFIPGLLSFKSLELFLPSLPNWWLTVSSSIKAASAKRTSSLAWDEEIPRRHETRKPFHRPRL